MILIINKIKALETSDILKLLTELKQHMPLANQLVCEWLTRLSSEGLIRLNGYNGNQIVIKKG